MSTDQTVLNITFSIIRDVGKKTRVECIGVTGDEPPDLKPEMVQLMIAEVCVSCAVEELKKKAEQPKYNFDHRAFYASAVEALRFIRSIIGSGKNVPAENFATSKRLS